MSNTNNVRLGPCRVFFGGVDLGYTQGGVEVEVKTDTHQVMVDQFGKSIINDIIMGRTCSVKVPMAETTLDNLVRIMPGATIQTVGGVLATGTATFTAVSTAGETVTINGVTFSCVASNPTALQYAIGSSVSDQAAKFANAVNNVNDIAVAVAATSAAGVVTFTAEGYDSAFYSYNSITLARTGTNVTLSGATLTGGVVPTKESVHVPAAVGVSLLATAQKLVLHPQANADNNRTEDFTIPLANAAGGLKFAYNLDKERVYDVTFNAYPDSITSLLFIVGDGSL